MSFQTATFGKQRLLALDLLRTVAALIVAVGHTGALYPADTDIAFSMCVAFFFILSGFVLAHAYGDEIRHERLTLRNFIVVRFARLYPLHILTAIVVAVILLRHGQGGEITPARILENLTVSQSLYTQRWSLNAPAWSIGPEIWGSLLIFALCSRGNATRVGLICIATALFLYVEFTTGFLQSWTARYWIGLGCFVLGWAAQRGLFDPIANRMPAPTAWCVAFAAFVATIFCPMRIAQTPFAEIGFILVFSVVVAALAPVQLEGFMANAAQVSGDLSYGIYLWHWPMLMIYRPPAATELTLFVAALIGISGISYVAFERPAKNALRRWLARSYAGPHSQSAFEAKES
jgi:peptidoglycan/LPS O-acetylase OafA/YrhL